MRARQTPTLGSLFGLRIYCKFLCTVKGVHTGKWETRLYDDLVVLEMTNLALPAAFYLLVLFLHMYAHRSYLLHPRS
uniref:Uncharacterized protein n=1 Tax=Hyaloperonospora arabidopsidis (strain Emoy2) TaxID=559515 RepID=M4BFK3_HYAAE